MYCLHDIRRNFTRKSNTADGRIDKEIGPNMGGISGYVDHMKAKFLTEWGVQINLHKSGAAALPPL